MTDDGPRVVRSESERDDALAVRHDVFVDEQGVPEALELDEYDRDRATTHFVAYDDGRAVGAARLRPVGDSVGKVERVAVRAEARGRGWGARLMDAVESRAREADLGTLTLHAQRPVEEFYRERGYRTVSDEFEEAGIPHVEMELELDGVGAKGDRDADDAGGTRE